MKSKKIIITLSVLVLILIPVSIKAVSTIVEKVKVVPDVPEPILPNVSSEDYISNTNDIIITEEDPILKEKLRIAEEKNKEKNEKTEKIIRKFYPNE